MKGSLFPTLWGGRGLAQKENNPFSSFQHEIDRVFQDFGRSFQLPAWSNSSEPRVDVTETDNDVQITAELPGVEEKDIEVTLSNGLLTIKGEKHAEQENKEKEYRMVERSYGSFSRTIPMPYEIDPETVDAKFAKGILTVILPKPLEARQEAKRIDIKSS